MQSLIIGRWRLRIDREATERYYQGIGQGFAELCGCDYCRNFIAAREQLYPLEVRQWLVELGIHYCREAEAYHIGELKPGLNRYAGWFYAVGEIEQEGPELSHYDLESGSAPFQFYFSNQSAKIAAASPTLQLDFEADVASG